MSLIFDFFRAFPGFFSLFQSAFLDRGDFDAGDEGLFGIDLRVAGVEGADAGERALADHVDHGAQPPAGEGYVMGREKQVQAVFRGVGLVLAFRDTFEGVAHQLRAREAVGAVVLGDELHERGAVVILLDALALGPGLLLGEGVKGSVLEK